MEFHEDIVDKEDPEIVEPSDILDDPSLMCPPSPHKKGNRTNKHKIKWHDTLEQPPENLTAFHDAHHEEEKPTHSDFGP